MKNIIGALILWLLICSPSFAESLGAQLVKLEGMYERGTITKQEFDKAKSILLKMDQDSSEKIEKIKKEITEEQKENKKKLIKELQAEVNQEKTYSYKVREFRATGSGQWEKMEFIIDDYRFYTNRPGGVRVIRISDGKMVAMISDKFKIKFKNGGESLFIVKKYKLNTLEKKESKLAVVNALNSVKKEIDYQLSQILPKKKDLPGRVTFEYNGQIILSWERAFISKHNAHFFQLLALDDQPFHFYITKDSKRFALNMAKFTKKIDIAISKVKIELAKKYNLTEEEIGLIIKKRKQNYDKQLSAITKETGRLIAAETEKSIEQETSKAIDTEVAKKVNAELTKELEEAVGKEMAAEITDSFEQAFGAEIDAAMEQELATEIDAAIAASIEEGISAATAEAAMRAGIEALLQGATIEQAIAVCKAAGGGSAACD